MAISSAGIGSGLDVAKIVEQMVAAEKIPLKKLEYKAEGIQTQISTYGEIKSLTSKLGDSASKLTRDSAWNGVTISSSNSTITGTMTGIAAPGTYNIDVEAIEAMIGPDTRAMMIPSLIGNLPDWDRIRALEHFGDLSVANLQNAIEASMTRPLANLLIGLGIRHLGGTGSQVLARALGHLDAIEAASEEEIAAVEGIGPVIAASVHSFFAQEHNRALIDRLRKSGLNFTGPGDPTLPQTLKGMSVVVTGTLERFSREAADEAIKSRGGKCPGSVSKKTTAVVVGEAPGAAKLTKAQELKIPILDEAGFEKLLETGEL